MQITSPKYLIIIINFTMLLFSEIQDLTVIFVKHKRRRSLVRTPAAAANVASRRLGVVRLGGYSR